MSFLHINTLIQHINIKALEHSTKNKGSYNKLKRRELK